MMAPGVWALSLTAASIGVVHTLSGPDHYVPLVALSRASRWRTARAMGVTLVAGMSHLGGSLLLGLLGVALGVAVHKLQIVESWRGNVAAFALIAFGIVYTAWGIRRGILGRTHEHSHVHADGTVHVHSHNHLDKHLHAHASQGKLALWGLLAIFALGSCEPLIPILMYPAARKSVTGLLTVVLLYSLATIAAMMTGVLVGLYGSRAFRFPRLERFSHALAGSAMTLCGIAIVAFGL